MQNYEGFGRPAKRIWEAERELIAALIDNWYGYKRLADLYGMTPTGMKSVLARLGLSTKRAVGQSK